MAARQVPNLSFEETRKSLNVFFKQQLDSLGLSIESLDQQTEEELRRSAIVIDQAIENHESFGKLAVSIEAEGAVVVVTRKTESHFEIGILPLLLERKQIILRRLSEFDTKKSILEHNFEIWNLNIQGELKKIAKREINRRLWAVIALLAAVWIILFLLIQKLGWDLLEPWTYLFGFAFVIAGYVYFVIREKEFSPFALYNQALEFRKEELFDVFKVDDEKYSS